LESLNICAGGNGRLKLLGPSSCWDLRRAHLRVAGELVDHASSTWRSGASTLKYLSYQLIGQDETTLLVGLAGDIEMLAGRWKVQKEGVRAFQTIFYNSKTLV